MSENTSRTCSKCSYGISDNEIKFCPKCGKKLPKPKAELRPLTIINADAKLSFSVKEAATAIGVSTFLIREKIRQGVLPYVPLNSRIVIRRADIEKYLADNVRFMNSDAKIDEAEII